MRSSASERKIVSEALHLSSNWVKLNTVKQKSSASKEKKAIEAIQRSKMCKKGSASE